MQSAKGKRRKNHRWERPGGKEPTSKLLSRTQKGARAGDDVCQNLVPFHPWCDFTDSDHKMLWSCTTKPEIWSTHVPFTVKSLQETTLHIERQTRCPSQFWRVPFTVWRLFRTLPIMKIKHRSITWLWKYDNLPMPDKPKMIFLGKFQVDLGDGNLLAK